MKNVKRFTLIAHGGEQAQYQPMSVLPVTATITHADVDLTWNCINCREVSREEFVSNVDITQLEDIAIIVRKDTIEIRKSPLHIGKHVSLATVIQLELLERYAIKQMANAHVRMGSLDVNVTDVLKGISR